MDFGIKGKTGAGHRRFQGPRRGSALALAAEGCKVAISARTQADVELTYATVERAMRRCAEEVMPRLA